VTADEVSVRQPARIWLAAVVSTAVLGLAVAAGLRSSPTSLGPLIAVESLSARFSGGLLALGTVAPLGYALVAGMVASVNPCGFVLLPTYLAYYLGDRHDEVGAGSEVPSGQGDAAGIRTETGPARDAVSGRYAGSGRDAASGRYAGSGRYRTGRAIAVSATMTASFVLLFGLAGLIATVAASGLASSLPWLGTAIGVALIALAGLVAAGRTLSFPLAPSALRRLRPATRNLGLSGYLAYGLAYALASLGCTLPVFIAVVGTSLQSRGLADAVGQFLLFGLGMGIIITVLTLATAWFGDGLVKRVRVIGRHVGWVSAAMLWLAGAYVVYYWLTTVRLL
jgi:cytochrome c-type biogenesis protein